MTDREIYEAILSDELLQKYVDEGNYKRLYRLLKERDSSIIPQELTVFLMNAEINIAEDGVVPTEAFKDFKELDNFDFSKISIIEPSAFEGSGLKKVVLRNQQKVGVMAFKDSAVEELYLGNDVEVGQAAFARCKNLKELYINGTVKLSPLCFASCRNLEEVAFDDGRPANQYIDDTFANVTHIDYVTIPADGKLNIFDRNIDIDVLYINGSREDISRIYNITEQEFIGGIKKLLPNIKEVELLK